MTSLYLNPLLVEPAVRAALAEDLGSAGDITSLATIPAGMITRASFAARQAGVVSGLELARAAFALFDAAIVFEPAVAEGEAVVPGQSIALVRGDARSVLSAERVALNYLGRLSGIATLTRAYVQRVAHTNARICCTRKTTPGLRAFEKYAVRCGGGMNHRFGLDDAILIKDNHIAVAGGIMPALRAARAAAGHLVKIEIEVDTLGQLDEVLAAGAAGRNAGADVVLLDNFDVPRLHKAVARIAGQLLTEASGGVTLDTVGSIAETGVDMISVGALTHSARVLDIGLDIVSQDPTADV